MSESVSPIDPEEVEGVPVLELAEIGPSPYAGELLLAQDDEEARA